MQLEVRGSNSTGTILTELCLVMKCLGCLRLNSCRVVNPGHVVFEMGAGTVAENTVPSDSDYDKIKDKAVAKFVKEIFAGVRQCLGTSSSESRSSTGSWTTEVC